RRRDLDHHLSPGPPSRPPDRLHSAYGVIAADRKDGSRRARLRLQSAHGVTPPIWQTIFHSGAATGCTDRRDSLTSVMSLSFGSALMAASVTGVLHGVSALTVTATQGSPGGAAGSGKLSRTISTMRTPALRSPE